jgi:hypothetical protein
MMIRQPEKERRYLPLNSQVDSQAIDRTQREANVCLSRAKLLDILIIFPISTGISGICYFS